MDKKILEDYGYVADSMKIRMDLIEKAIEKAKESAEELEKVQKELKFIKRNANKNGLFTREELFKKNWSLEEALSFIKEKNYNKLDKKYPPKQVEKRNKI